MQAGDIGSRILQAVTDPLENFLSASRQAGQTDSEGTFTIDFAKAREKMARFQLANPQEFVLKIVMAACAAGAGGLDVRTGTRTGFILRDWPDELTIDSLARRLCADTILSGEHALDHLAVAVNALLGLDCGDILIQHTPKQGKSSLLRVDEGLQWENPEGYNGEAGQLVLVVGERGQISQTEIKRLLQERCYAPGLSITIDGGGPLPLTVPPTSGAHRIQYFRNDHLLASHSYGAFPDTPPRPRDGRPQLFDFAREANLRLTVDLDPTAAVWFSRFGVLAELVRLPLGVPGVAGVVSADDLATDLTGFQFSRDEKFAEVERWLRDAAEELRHDALLKATRISADSQPANANAPLHELFAGLSCVGSALGFVIMSNIVNFAKNPGWGLIAFFFWLFLPLALNIWRIRSKGSEADKSSSDRAQQYVVAALQRQP